MTVWSVTVDGKPHNLLSMDLRLMNSGPWTADLDIDVGQIDVGTSIVLRNESIGEWRGTVYSGGHFAGRSRALVIAGTGGMRNELASRHYSQGQPGSARVQTILNDIAADAGEIISPDIATSVLSRNLDLWTRPRGNARNALWELSRVIGITWRMDDLGRIWIGNDDYAIVETDAVVLDEKPAIGCRVWDIPDGISGLNFRPGKTIGGISIATVAMMLTPKQFRVKTYTSADL